MKARTLKLFLLIICLLPLNAVKAEEFTSLERKLWTKDPLFLEQVYNVQFDKRNIPDIHIGMAKSNIIHVRVQQNEIIGNAQSNQDFREEDFDANINTNKLKLSGADNQNIAINNVYRKSKLEDSLKKTAKYIINHNFYIVLSEDLDYSKEYTLDFNGQLINFTPKNTISLAIHLPRVFDIDSPTKRAKLSTWMSPEGGGINYPNNLEFKVKDHETGNTVFTNTAKLEDQSNLSKVGAETLSLEFDNLGEGKYYLEVAGVGKTLPFRVEDDFFEKMLDKHMEGLLVHRAFADLDEPYIDYHRPGNEDIVYYKSSTSDADLTFFGGGNVFKVLPANADRSKPYKLSGGWFDAGDFDTKVEHFDIAESLIDLYDTNPNYFRNLDVNIPESNNQIPDLLDEALWGLSLYMNIQDIYGDGVSSGFEFAHHPKSNSWEEKEGFIFAPDFWASHRFTAVSLKLAEAIEEFSPEIAADLKDRATRAFNYAEDAYLNSDIAHKDKGSKASNARQLAALMMYKATGDTQYHTIFRSINKDRNYYASYVYAQMSKNGYPEIDLTWQDKLKTRLIQIADKHLQYSIENPYDTIDIPKNGQNWGYDTYITTTWGDYLMMVHQITGDDKYLNALGASLHFALGMNPDNLSLITGMVKDKLAYDEPDDTLHADTLRNQRATPDGITLYGFYEAPWFAWNSINQKTGNIIFNTNTKNLVFPALEAFSDLHNMVPMTEYTTHQTIEDQILAFGYMASQSPNPVSDIDSLLRNSNDNSNGDQNDDPVVVDDEQDTEVNPEGINLSLVDAESDTLVNDYINVPSKVSINIAELGFNSLSFVVDSNIDTITSVKFSSDIGTRSEGAAPYAWFGDFAGDYTGKEFNAGVYNLEVELFGTNQELLASKNYEITILDEDLIIEDPVNEELFTVSLIDAVSKNVISGFETISDTITINLANITNQSFGFKANLNTANPDSGSVKGFKYTSTTIKDTINPNFGIIGDTAMSFSIAAYDNLEASGESILEKFINVNFINSTPDSGNDSSGNTDGNSNSNDGTGGNSDDQNSDDNNTGNETIVLSEAEIFGAFNVDKDLMSFHHDFAPDRDDGHAIVANKVLADRYQLNHIFVGAATGINEDRYNPKSTAYINSVLGEANWINYLANKTQAASEVGSKWIETIKAGGRVFVAEGGQSDLSLKAAEYVNAQGYDTRNIYIVQHSRGFNTKNTSPGIYEALEALGVGHFYIADGNKLDNGTADLSYNNAEETNTFRAIAAQSKFASDWEKAWNFYDLGKVDFSDTVEVLHILGVGLDKVNNIVDFANYFLKENTNPPTDDNNDQPTDNDGDQTSDDNTSNELITLSLIDADKNELVSSYEDLGNSSDLNLNALALNKINFVTNIDSSLLEQVKLIEFKATDLNRKERGAPYTWFGDSNGNYYSKDLNPGTYNLTVNVVSNSDEIIASRAFTINILSSNSDPVDNNDDNPIDDDPVDTGDTNEPSGERIVLHAKTPQNKFGDPVGPEARLADSEGNKAAQNQQFDLKTGTFKLAVDDVFWGDIQIQGIAATGERAIIKSTHDLIGIKSFSYNPEHYGPDPFISPKGTGGSSFDNYINNFGSTYTKESETLQLNFPYKVKEVDLIVVKLDDGETLVWKGYDKSGKLLDSGSLSNSDGEKIPHIDSQNNFGEDRTHKIKINSAQNFERVELEAGANSDYALTGIEYTK
ncbi:MAG: glycoside hydrolase family 9 protein [Candidatus Caenarcaniphilales bacterium]|nr:glycoside hydrolase family 9 protein [Candidatus Caenarcaniphilales bacterium]